LEKFLETVVERFGGVVGLVDLYCMYNRFRGTDLISPEDLNIACSRLNVISQKFMLKIYRSGVKTIQSSKCFDHFIDLEHFNEDTYYRKIADTLHLEATGLTAVKLAEKLRINVVLMKEHIQIAEEKGFVCRDESYEGVLWFDNKFT